MLTRAKKDYIIDLLKAAVKLGLDDAMTAKAIYYLSEDRDRQDKKKSEQAPVSPIPTIEEVIDYFQQNGYNSQGARDAFNYYNAGAHDGYWWDKYGDKVISWRMKCRSVWFRDKYKIEFKIGPTDRKISR